MAFCADVQNGLFVSEVSHKKTSARVHGRGAINMFCTVSIGFAQVFRLTGVSFAQSTCGAAGELHLLSVFFP